MAKNYNCDGIRCVKADSEVRVYPLGSGGNLILCMVCFAHENAYRFARGVETRRPEDFPRVKWTDAKSYPESST